MFEKNVAVRRVLPPIRGSHVEPNGVFDKFERAIEYVEALSDDQVRVEGIYRQAAPVSSVTSLYSCSPDLSSLPIGKQNGDYPYTVACVLKYAFQKLIENGRELLVVPASEEQLKKAVEDLGKSTESSERPALVRAVLSHLTPRAQSALRRVLDHLNRVASFSAMNKMDLSNLAKGFLGPKLGGVVWSDINEQFKNVEIGNKAAEFLIGYSESVTLGVSHVVRPVVTSPMPQPVPRPVKSKLCSIQ